MNISKFSLIIGVVIMQVCFAQNVFSQSRDSLLNVYNTQTIHTFGKYYIKGDKRLSFGDLKPEFQSGITKSLYKKSKGDLILSKFLTVTSVAALVTSAVIRKNNKTSAWVFSIAGIGLNLGSLHFRKQSGEILERALWQRNKEVLFGLTQ